MTVDKEVLYEFLVSPIPEVTGEHLTELNKVITIVVNKHFKNYEFKDSSQSIVTTDILLKKHGFDINRDAYNYLYTMIRNLVGNFLRKDNYLDNKSVLFESRRSDDPTYDSDDLGVKEGADFTDEFQENSIPDLEEYNQIKPYIDFLTCSVQYDVKRVSRSDSLALLLYMEKNLKTRAVEVTLSKEEYNAVYRLLKKLF